MALLLSTNQYAQVNASVYSGQHMSVSLWFRPDDDTTANYPFSMWVGSGDDTYTAIIADMASTNNPAKAVWRHGTNAVATVDGLVNGTWHHLVGTFPSSAERHIILDDGTPGDDTTNVGYALTLTSATIGRLTRFTPGRYCEGAVAEVGLWGDYTLTIANITALAGGALPSSIQPGSLIGYWPLVDDVNDDSGSGFNMTAYNSPTYTDHPPAFSSGSLFSGADFSGGFQQLSGGF